MKVQTGLDRLLSDEKLRQQLDGNIGYLCHPASVTSSFQTGAVELQKKFGKRLKRLFGPQHGIFADVQANMIETADLMHPYLHLPVTSLYGETRVPPARTLRNLDHLLVDLQDVGTRIYTYIWTLSHVMEACRGKDITVWVLDRPNPIGGVAIEGNMLDPNFASFVGRYPMPMRHGLTMAEVAHYLQARFPATRCKLRVVTMKGWKRSMFFEETGLPFVPPSPNIPTVDSCFPYVGAVLYEGTNISEGRGTTRPFEFIGHPKLEPHALCDDLDKALARAQCSGFKLRPAAFIPTFDKHKGKLCGGFQMLVTNRKQFRSWTVFQVITRVLMHRLGKDFRFNPPPYEYEYKKLPIDILNGTDALREWYQSPKGSMKVLREIEHEGMSNYRWIRRDCLLYSA
jgi:uncharacterized protein YbbC (DUF1343 family)